MPRGRGAPARRGRSERDRSERDEITTAPWAGGADFMVAELSREGKFLVARPFFERGRRVTLDRATRTAGPGDLVVVRAGRATRGQPKVVKVLGRPDVARDVLEGLMIDRGLSRRFPPGLERAAGEVVPEPEDGPTRRDLRHLATLTIDPATARDFDDAISAEELGPDHWRVWVHIADVAAHVRPGSPIDREALRRSTSVYVPGAVEPMLPTALSNDACSLRPHLDRLAVTVEMELRGAERVRTAFHRSTIRSDQRLDYDQVDRIFAGQERAEEPWAAPLAAARAAARALGHARQSQGAALTIETEEPEFSFTSEGHVERARPTPHTESHRLIEQLMVCANEAVADQLEARSVPALYRVHERPDPSGVERLLDQLESLGVATPPAGEPGTMTSAEAAEVVAQASRLVAEHVDRTGRGRQALTSLVLRSLKQAHYTPHNLGHAGLGSPRYCHFTSPIRRYPDLVCHRALLSAVGGGEDAPRGGAPLQETGTWCSARERDAASIERAADDVAMAFLLERELFEGAGSHGHWRSREWDGEVVGLIPAGAFVAFGDGFEGLLPVRRLRGDWWEINEQGTVLTGTESGKAIRLGDPVRVVIDRIDPPRGRVSLDVAGL